MLLNQVIRYTVCKTFPTMQRRLFSQENLRNEHVRPLFKALHWLPVKDRIIFKIGTLFPVYFCSFCSLFVVCCFCCCFMVSCHHTCHRFSLYTLLLAQSIPVQIGGEEKKKKRKTNKLFLVQYGNLRALVTGRSLFRLPLSRTTFLLTHPTLHLSLTVQNVS